MKIEIMNQNNERKYQMKVYLNIQTKIFKNIKELSITFEINEIKKIYCAKNKKPLKNIQNLEKQKKWQHIVIQFKNSSHY